MPLEGFGAILSFAAEMENSDQQFYRDAAANPSCADLKDMFEQFAGDARKGEALALRARQESVTEMILESIPDFTRQPFLSERAGADALGSEAVLAKARELEEKAVDFYETAAAKIKALPEVARVLKTLGQKRKSHLDRLAQHPGGR